MYNSISTLSIRVGGQARDIAVEEALPDLKELGDHFLASQHYAARLVEVACIDIAPRFRGNGSPGSRSRIPTQSERIRIKPVHPIGDLLDLRDTPCVQTNDGTGVAACLAFAGSRLPLRAGAPWHCRGGHSGRPSRSKGDQVTGKSLGTLDLDGLIPGQSDTGFPPVPTGSVRRRIYSVSVFIRDGLEVGRDAPSDSSVSPRTRTSSPRTGGERSTRTCHRPIRFARDFLGNSRVSRKPPMQCSCMVVVLSTGPSGDSKVSCHAPLPGGEWAFCFRRLACPGRRPSADGATSMFCSPH